MKRLLLGVCILVLLLGMGIGVSVLFQTAHQPISALLEDARDAALEENWDRAIDLAEQAQARWSEYREVSAAFADHAPMDEIEGLFAQLEVYSRQRHGELFPSLCAQLARLTEAMIDSHRFQWWTVL